MRHRPRPITMLIATTSLLTLVSTAAAADYPPQAGPVIDVDVQVDTPGATVKIDGRDWSPDTTVEITRRDIGQGQQGAPAGQGFRSQEQEHSAQPAAGVPVGEATTDSRGRFRTAVELPEGLDLAGQQLTATERGAGRTDASSSVSVFVDPARDPGTAPAADVQRRSATTATTSPSWVLVLVAASGAATLWQGRRHARNFDRQ